MERTLFHHQHQIDNNSSSNSSLVITSPPSCTSDNNSSSHSHNEGSAPIQPPVTPKAVFASDNSPYPTTFVQADTSNFKQVVQMLTGSTTPSDQNPQQLQRPDHPGPLPRAAAIPPIRTSPKKQQGFRLYERRNSLKNALMINTILPGLSSPRDASAAAAQTPPCPGLSPRNLFPHLHLHHEVLSPSVLDFPKLTLSSPVTPLNDNPFGKSSPSLGNSSSSEEDRAIAEKGFYFHPPSKANTPRDSDPQLLPLFPVTSPKISGAPS